MKNGQPARRSIHLAEWSFAILGFLLVGSLSFAGFRLALILENAGDLAQNSEYVRQAMARGLLFDLKILAILSIAGIVLLVLRALMPLRRKGKVSNGGPSGKERRLLVACMSGFLAIDLLSIAQHYYFSFFKGAFSSIIFGLWEDDTQAIVSTMAREYPLAAILGVCVLFLLVQFLAWHRVRVVASNFAQRHLRGRLARGAALAVFAVGLLIAARGSISSFPLMVDDCVVTPHRVLNESVKNAPYALFSAWNERRDQARLDPLPTAQFLARSGFESVEQLASTLGRRYDTANPESFIFQRAANGTKTRINTVVFALMESWTARFHDDHTADNNLLGTFETHAQEDYFSKRFLSSQIGTFSSLEALLLNAPLSPLSSGDLTDFSFPGSSVKPFKRAGFESIFVYGGSSAWRNIGRSLRAQGFDKVFDMADISARFPEAKVRTWGIDDEYLFDFAFEKILEAERNGRRLFIFILTTTNHPPHEVPKSYKALPINWSKMAQSTSLAPSEAIAILQTVQYSNQKLGEFLSKIKSSELAQSTVVAATGDHSIRKFYNVVLPRDYLKLYAVPLYFYLPPELRSGVHWDGDFADHRHIFPTLYHLCLSDDTFPEFGQSLFSTRPDADRFGLITLDLARDKLLISARGAIEFGSKGAKDLHWDPEENLAPGSPSSRAAGEALQLQAQRSSAVNTSQEWFIREQLRNRNSRTNP